MKGEVETEASAEADGEVSIEDVEAYFAGFAPDDPSRKFGLLLIDEIRYYEKAVDVVENLIAGLLRLRLEEKALVNDSIAKLSNLVEG